MIKRDLIIVGILLILLLLFISLKLSFGANIVCINTGTLRSGINEIDDIVEIQDDDVELTGAGYNYFKIIQIPEITKDEVVIVLNNRRVETEVDPNNPDIEYWQDPNALTWYKIVNKPKYAFTTRDLTIQDITNLADKLIHPDTRLNILLKVKDKIPLDPVNGSIIRARLRKRFRIINTLNAEEINIP